MGVTNYISMNGMLMGEMSSGVMRNYGTDALGSVVETVINGVEENTYQYKPYGGLLAKTGAATDPSFLWNGGSGYRATSQQPNDAYVRRRTYSLLRGSWSSTDLLWPMEPPFAYALNDPILGIDPSGLATYYYTTTKEKSTCTCNNTVTFWDLTWGINFTGAEIKKGLNNGWFLQEVYWSFTIGGCGQGQPSQQYISYVEGWQVTNGKIYNGLSSHHLLPGVDLDSTGGSLIKGCAYTDVEVTFMATYCPLIQYPSKFPFKTDSTTNLQLQVYFYPMSGSTPDKSAISAWWPSECDSYFITRSMSKRFNCDFQHPKNNYCNAKNTH